MATDRITSLFSMYNDESESDQEQEDAQNPIQNPNQTPNSPSQPDQSDSKTLIVNYAHDEMAISPNHHGLRDGRNVADSVSISENLEGLKSDLNDNLMDFSNSNDELARAEEIGANCCADLQKEDELLYNFLGPPVTSKCRPELQDKINKFISLKKSGRSFNDDLRNRKNYRNPDFLQHAVGYQGIDQVGSCFRKDVFDPHGYDKSDFYDEIEAEMKREIERKDQERKRSPKVDFVSSGIQPVPPIPTVPVLKPGSSSGEPAPTRETRHKRSKWDKVESDVKNPIIPSGHENLLHAVSVGAGYSGFAQQKRKEAEEKKASDRKSVDRKS